MVLLPVQYKVQYIHCIKFSSSLSSKENIRKNKLCEDSRLKFSRRGFCLYDGK